MASEWIDTSTAASELGITRRRVLQLITSNQLPANALAGGYIIKRADLKLVRNRRKAGRPALKRSGK